MPLTGHPPHRPVRAELPHTVPALGNDGQNADWARDVYILVEVTTLGICPQTYPMSTFCLSGFCASAP